jgi:bifunctional DNase/RNase
MFEIDSRTSDAIAMAVRFECPIYTYDFILEAAGVILDENEEEGGSQSIIPTANAAMDSQPLERLSSQDLSERLQSVLDAEDYEMAAKIRDEMKRREKN